MNKMRLHPSSECALSRWLPIAVGAVCLAPFTPLLTRVGMIVSDPHRDYAIMHLPLAEFACQELWAGRLPLWNPYVACGQSLQATPQAMLFYPLLTPLCLLLGANEGLKVSLFTHLALCYVGTYLLARRLLLSQYAAAYAALVVTWSGALLGQLAEGHVGAVFETSLAPWFFLALVSLSRNPCPMASLRLALAGAMCALAAQPQVFYYTLVAGVMLAAGSLCRGHASTCRARAVLWGIAAAFTAMLLAAVQLVPAVELVLDGLWESERGTSGYGTDFALNGADSARLLMPYLNGNPFAHVPQFDRADYYHERVIYLGLAPPLLAIFGLSRDGTSRWQWAVALAIVLSLGIAFGASTPAFALLDAVLPGLRLFRCPGRVFLVASLPAAMLAGRGFDALRLHEARGGVRRLIGVGAMTAAALSIPGYAALTAAPTFDWQSYAQFASQHLREELWLWLFLLVDITIIGGLAASGRISGHPLWLAIFAATALDLGHFNVENFGMRTPTALPLDGLRPMRGQTRFVEGADFEHVRYGSLRYSHLTSAAILNRRATIATYDGGVLPAATERLYRAIDANSRPVLGLASCGFACSLKSRVSEHPDGDLPRIHFLAGEFQGSQLPIEVVSEAYLRRLKRRLRPVRLVRDVPTKLELELIAPNAGWLIVADTYYPGWVCRVDGEKRPIERVHGVFRGVRLPSGWHRVSMTYEPRSFLIGAATTFAGLLLVASICGYRIFAATCSRPASVRTASLIFPAERTSLRDEAKR